MFTRYWRSYPPFLQLLLFVLMMFTVASFGSVLLWVFLPKLTGYSIDQLANASSTSPVAQIRGRLMLQALSSFMSFVVPPLLFAQLTTPHRAEFLGLRAPKRPLHLPLAVGLMLGLLPTWLAGQAWLEQTGIFGAAAKTSQESTQAAFTAMLSLRSPADQLLTVVTLALLPAVGEELLFRGILQRFAMRITRRPFASLALSAFVFSAVHTSPYGLPFIFASGLLLGGIYWLTGSLYVSMAAHFCWNGLQLLLAKLPQTSAFMDSGKMPAAYFAGGLILAVLCGWSLWRTRAPLPADWPQDFRPDEEPSPPAPGRIF